MTDAPEQSKTSTEQSWTATNLLANRPFIVSVLYVATYFTGFSVIVGVVLAYVFASGKTEEWERNQFTYLIWTFWMLAGGLVLAILGAIVLSDMAETSVAIVPFALLVFAIFILTAARTIYAMVNAVRQKPMPRARTLLI